MTEDRSYLHGPTVGLKNFAETSMKSIALTKRNIWSSASGG